MSDPAFLKNNDDVTLALAEPSREPHQPTGLGWQEFFQDLGQDPEVEDLNSGEQGTMPTCGCSHPDGA